MGSWAGGWSEKCAVRAAPIRTEPSTARFHRALTPLRRLLHRFQLLCAGAFKHVQEMQGFRFEVKMRTGRPSARIAAKTNDLAAVIGTCRGTSVEVAVSRLDACPSQVKRPPVGAVQRLRPTPSWAARTGRPTRHEMSKAGWSCSTPWVTTPDIGTSNAANRPSKNRQQRRPKHWTQSRTHP